MSFLQEILFVGAQSYHRGTIEKRRSCKRAGVSRHGSCGTCLFYSSKGQVMSTFSRYLVLTITAILLGATAACAPTADRRGSGEVVDDAGITARVKTALVREEGLRAFTINVDTSRGEVQLSGFLPTED